MRNGFTLIETLVALLLLAIVVPAVLESQASAIKIERIVRASESVAREIERVLVESICGHAATNRSDETRFACRIESSHEPSDMMRWEIVPDERPSFKIAAFTRLFPE